MSLCVDVSATFNRIACSRYILNLGLHYTEHIVMIKFNSLLYLYADHNSVILLKLACSRITEMVSRRRGHYSSGSTVDYRYICRRVACLRFLVFGMQ